MPPIMGAAAFLMAEYMGVPYIEVAAKAIIPALLYFAGIQGLKETSKVPVFCSLELVVATMLGGLLFKERLLPLSLLGTVMILVSIILMNRKTTDKTEDADAS